MYNTIRRAILTMYAALAIVGAVLLIVDVVGLFVPLRNDAIYAEPNAGFGLGDLTLPAAGLRAALVRQPAEAADAYVRRSAVAVQQGLAHYWRPEQAARYRLHLPIWENWVLWALGFWQPQAFGLYEFCDPARALDRGVGLCSQHAILEVDALHRAGIPAQIIGSRRHVLVTAEVTPGVWWLVDPDYGVVVPQDLSTVQARPELIAAAYRPTDVALLTDVYATETFARYPDIAAYCGARLPIENLAYMFKWVLPLLALALGALPWLALAPEWCSRSSILQGAHRYYLRLSAISLRVSGSHRHQRLGQQN
jgi:hypothetical protein